MPGIIQTETLNRMSHLQHELKEVFMLLCYVMEMTQWSTSHYIQYNMGKNWAKCKMLNDWFSWSINFVFIVIVILTWEVTYTFKGFSWCQLRIAKRKYVILPLSYKDIKLLCIQTLYKKNSILEKFCRFSKKKKIYNLVGGGGGDVSLSTKIQPLPNCT